MPLYPGEQKTQEVSRSLLQTAPGSCCQHKYSPVDVGIKLLLPILKIFFSAKVSAKHPLPPIFSSDCLFVLWRREWIYPKGILMPWWQTVYGLCWLGRADLHASPLQACERPVSLKRFRANQA
jgi:hypothetical protein